MENLFDHDFGLLVRAKLLELGLEKVHSNSKSFKYTNLERISIIEKSLKDIYDIVGVSDTPEIKKLAKNIFDNYRGLSYTFFPKLIKPYELSGGSYSIGESLIKKTLVIDESDWKYRKELYLQPIICKSFNQSISDENLKKIFEFFTNRPITDLTLLERQIEETMKLLYKVESNFEIKLNIFYGKTITY